MRLRGGGEVLLEDARRCAADFIGEGAPEPSSTSKRQPALTALI